MNYGTVLVDMETSRVIDLLPSREGSQLKKWLAKHPGIKIVTRDRASSYASAVKEIHPEAHQVADRFHLLMNLSDALILYFKSVSGKLKTILNAHKEKLLDHKRQQTDLKKKQVIVSQNKPITADPRQAVIQKVKELQQQKYPARILVLLFLNCARIRVLPLYAGCHATSNQILHCTLIPWSCSSLIWTSQKLFSTCL